MEFTIEPGKYYKWDGTSLVEQPAPPARKQFTVPKFEPEYGEELGDSVIYYFNERLIPALEKWMNGR